MGLTAEDAWVLGQASGSSNPAVWAGIKAPEGYELAWKVVRPDGRTYNDFRWPFHGAVVCDPERIVRGNRGPCPVRNGDGLCLAKTWDGAASGGVPAFTGLAVAYDRGDVLGESEDKLRVSQCQVLAVLDLQRLIRETNLYGANLRGANLDGANLRGANLYGADLVGADLVGADLRETYLRETYLRGADLHGADLRGANLDEAHLSGALNLPEGIS